MDVQTYRQAVAAEVRAEMARQQVTNVRLAQITGIPARSLSRRLNGQGLLDVETLSEIASALGREPKDFLPRIETLGRVVPGVAS